MAKILIHIVHGSGDTIRNSPCAVVREHTGERKWPTSPIPKVISGPCRLDTPNIPSYIIAIVAAKTGEWAKNDGYDDGGENRGEN